MLSTLKHPWRRALLQAGPIYAICVATLLWLLPPPVHFQFSSDRDGRLFSPTSEPALVRLHSTSKKPGSIQDYYIEHVDLPTGNAKRIPLDPGDKKLAGVKNYVKSRDGSLFLIMHQNDFITVSVWDGCTGKLRFDKYCQALHWSEMPCKEDGTCFALKSHTGTVDFYDAQHGQTLGFLPENAISRPVYFSHMLFSVDGKWLLRRYGYLEAPRTEVTELFDMTSFEAVYRATDGFPVTSDEILPAPKGFWLSEWNRSDETLTLSYLDAPTGKRTTLAPELSSRLGGFPHIFSDNAGHLYLLQNRKPSPDDWQKRTRQTIFDWLKKIGFEWETTDEIVLRHISPDGKRLLSEQTFSANYAEISPDGQYLILMSQMKDDSRYVVYHYPTRLNWTHSLLWPLIPAMILAWIRYRTFRKKGLGATVSVIRNRV
ncbi:MAG: hypothetical protein QM703_00105 [Gemmatales bacterium]